MKPIYFLSDLHLGATYCHDNRDKEKLVAEFLLSLCDKAQSVYLLGDILDYWFEYRTVVPRGYIRFFGALARLVDSGVKIKWFIGNHDIWLFDYLREEIGIEVIDGFSIEEINGKKFFLSHGDGVGRLPRGFRLIRNIFRNRVCQKLYASIHPRWTIPFAHRWSSSSRMEKSAPVPFRGEEESLVQFARETLVDHPDINYFVFGHRHELVDIKLTPNCSFIILGDWIDKFSFGIFDGETFELKKLTKG